MPKAKHAKQPEGVQKLRLENAALKQENLKLQRRIVTLEAQMTSARHKIIALQERVPVSKLTDEELEERIHHEKTDGSA